MRSKNSLSRDLSENSVELTASPVQAGYDLFQEESNVILLSNLVIGPNLAGNRRSNSFGMNSLHCVLEYTMSQPSDQASDRRSQARVYKTARTASPNVDEQLIGFQITLADVTKQEVQVSVNLHRRAVRSRAYNSSLQRLATILLRQMKFPAPKAPAAAPGPGHLLSGVLELLLHAARGDEVGAVGAAELMPYPAAAGIAANLLQQQDQVMATPTLQPRPPSYPPTIQEREAQRWAGQPAIATPVQAAFAPPPYEACPNHTQAGGPGFLPIGAKPGSVAAVAMAHWRPPANRTARVLQTTSKSRAKPPPPSPEHSTRKAVAQQRALSESPGEDEADNSSSSASSSMEDLPSEQEEKHTPPWRAVAKEWAKQTSWKIEQAKKAQEKADYLAERYKTKHGVAGAGPLAAGQQQKRRLRSPSKAPERQQRHDERRAEKEHQDRQAKRGREESPKHHRDHQQKRRKVRRHKENTTDESQEAGEALGSAAPAAEEEPEYDLCAQTLSSRQTRELTNEKHYDPCDFRWWELSKALITLLRYKGANYMGMPVQVHDYEVWRQPGSISHGGVQLSLVARILGKPEDEIWAIVLGDKYPDGQNRFIVVLAHPPQRPEPVIVATHEVRRTKACGGHGSEKKFKKWR